MNKANLKKMSSVLIALFLSALLILTTPAKAAYLSYNITPVSGGTTTISVTITKENIDLLRLEGIKDELVVNLTYPNGTTVTLNVSDATISTSGNYGYGYGYVIPDGTYGYDHGYGYDNSAASITFTWKLNLPDGTYKIDSKIDGITKSIEFTVGGKAEEGGVSSSAPPAPGETTTITLSETPSNVELGVRDSVSFEIGGESHSATLISMGINYVVLEIASTPFRVTINVGETVNVDVNKDGVDDLSIFLEKIEGGKAYLTFSKVVPPSGAEVPEEKAPAPTEEVSKNVSAPVTEEMPKGGVTEGGNVGVLIATIVIIVAAIVGVIWYFKKKEV